MPKLLANISLILALAACTGDGSSSEDAELPGQGAADATPGDGGDPILPACAALPQDSAFEHEPGIRELVAGDFYVVHSGMYDLQNPNFYESSNIFVIRGQSDNGGTDIWLFGSGYGDPDGDVLELRITFDAIRSAAADALDVSKIIGGCFGIAPENTHLRFVTPHFHLDHINQAIFSELRSLGYRWSETEVYVHVADYELAFCGEACRGSSTQPPWDPDLVARGSALGHPSDGCDEPVLSFETPALGTWTVVHAMGHTDGTLSLDNTTLGVRLIGAATECPTPVSLRQIGIHGSVAL